MLQKRLELGRFAWPDADTPVLQLSATELHALLGGLDFRQAERLPRVAKISKPPEPPATFAS
ncbi:MAG: IS66 family insertion sequence element accessory protein TnpB [Planctomycetes bacterium]|nr:IS66 family insertion sequence element accessory protein TnpB [Planctomycetota bacterium]